MFPRFLNELLLICQFELNRSFATRMGLLNLLTFAVVWCFILLYPLRLMANMISQGKVFMQETGFFEFMGFDAWQHWPIPEFGVFWQFSLILFPMLSISLAADQTCTDRERGTLRFLALRSSRDGLFFGRFVGAMLVQAVLISVSALTVFGLVLYQGSKLYALAATSLSVIVVNVVLAILPFTAMMAALSAQLKTPRNATVWAILIWTFSSGIIGMAAYYFPVLAAFKYLVPGYQLSDLGQLSEWQTLQLAYIPLLQSLILLGAGRWIMARQAL